MNNFRKNLIYFRPYHWALEGLAVVLAVAAIVVAAVGRSGMPDQVPTHWDFQGNPNGWGSPNSFLVFPIIMLAVILLTSFTIHILDVAKWNMPFQLKPGREVPVARAFITSLLAMNVELGGFALRFTLRTVQQNMAGTAAFITGFVVVLMLTLVAGIAVAAIKNK